MSSFVFQPVCSALVTSSLVDQVSYKLLKVVHI